MTEQSFTRTRLLRWLGFQPSGKQAGSGSPGEGDHAVEDDPRTRRRRQLLADITSFLLTHRLEVNPSTLAIAYELMTGANPLLGRRVWHRIEASQPVTLEWLEDTARRSGSGNATQANNQLMDTMETTIRRFAKTAGDARSATSAYSCALQEHVGGLTGHEGSAAATAVNRMVQDMLARTRKLEMELDRSEKETRKLEKRLADARHEAEVDHLTGLPNRRAFEAVFAREAALAKASGEPLSVAFCDIDHFKRVNDTHGHEAGDRVLRSVAQALAAISDDACHVARHGGEEFVVVLRGRTLADAQQTLDGAREAMAAKRLVNRTSDVPFGQITFSAGIAEVGAYSEARDALRAADHALFQAKKSGRNRVLVASPPKAKAPRRD